LTLLQQTCDWFGQNRLLISCFVDCALSVRTRYFELFKAIPATPPLSSRCFTAPPPHTKSPASTIFLQAAVFHKFDEVPSDRGAVRACLLFGYLRREPALLPSEGHQVCGEFGQVLGEQFFAFHLFAQAFDLGAKR
jgi:hypothetical protein